MRSSSRSRLCRGLFEVGLFKPDTLASRDASMIPRAWDTATLIRSVPWLRYQNADGRNIYVRPKGEHDLSLVDDLTANSVRRMTETGFTPAAIIETLPGNFQAWLKNPAIPPREISTAPARKLAEEFGADEAAADDNTRIDLAFAIYSLSHGAGRRTMWQPRSALAICRTRGTPKGSKSIWRVRFKGFEGYPAASSTVHSLVAQTRLDFVLRICGRLHSQRELRSKQHPSPGWL